MDTSPSVLDALEAVLTPETIRMMSSQLGTDISATSSAVSMTLPILLGGLANNAADADGAAALDAALGSHDGAILDRPAALPGAGDGAAILRHVLGTRRGPVQEGVARATGLSAQQAGELLTLLAPLIMGVLGRMKQQQNIGADQLPVVLGKASLDMARQSTAIGDLSRILSSSDHGQIADEVARIGSSIVGGMLGRDASS
ncbi:MAG TPA: DUF937 domain-containing protein [Thermoanaerobaculia bacterium]|nr:DUF937 domain-containing protein [Thermoanaerobaculia bacterium]